MTARCAISWSAGKDSWLALVRAREQGLAVTTFVTMCDEDGKSKSHSLPRTLVEAQVRALGGEPVSVRVPPGEYAARFDAVLRDLAAAGHTHMVFGDIDLQAHRDWLAPACERAGLVPLFPLWGESRAALARELVTRGVCARVVCVDTRWLDATFCGAPYDADFLARLPAGVCPCGEDGEFHTFVTGGPGFAAAVDVTDGPQRHVASSPPFKPTTFVFLELALAAEPAAGALSSACGTLATSCPFPVNHVLCQSLPADPGRRALVRAEHPHHDRVRDRPARELAADPFR